MCQLISRQHDDKRLASELTASPPGREGYLFFMAIRHPPEDQIPRVVRGGRVPPPRIVRYEEPQPSFRRRILRFFWRPYFVIPLALCAVLVVTVLSYYWIVFSARIDNLLKGE